MKTFLDITNELMKEKNLAYSPKTFNNIFNEVKSTPKYIESNEKWNNWLLSIAPKQKEQTFSFMSNHLTTDNRLK
jgi:hypothetical protein|tara:strand:- start:691 stop:915 length:225 start_codon:yes stop_codon:yes gene_type:complete